MGVLLLWFEIGGDEICSALGVDLPGTRAHARGSQAGTRLGGRHGLGHFTRHSPRLRAYAATAQRTGALARRQVLDASAVPVKGKGNDGVA